MRRQLCLINNINMVSDSCSFYNNPLNDHNYCSQWITGQKRQMDSALSEHIAVQREKRQRKEVHDPEFSQFTSSEYSSSDAESDPESEYDSEDDPNRPWCSCEKPDDGNFMIECEVCKYWFHGSCVGVTKSLSKRWEKEGKEWFCSDCDHLLQSGTPRDTIPPRLVKKEKKKLSSRSGKRRGRPRKSDNPPREVTTRLSLRNAKKTNMALGPKTGKSNARIESFEKFDDQQRLKELIKERKKAFFLKQRLSKQIKDDKMQKMSLGRHSLTGPLGNSLDSLATTTSSPNMNNLPINIKSEHKERSKPNIVLQINTKKDRDAVSSGQRIVTAIVKGEEVAPAPVTNVPDDPSPNAKKDQDSSTVLAKASIKLEATRASPELATTNSDKKNLFIVVSQEQTQKPENLSPNWQLSNQSTSFADNLAFLDTTNEHQDHVFDMNCRICTKQQVPNAQCWSGTITMSEVGKFNASAKPVSGNLDFMKNEISHTLVVCGRIAPDQVSSYIKKLKSTTKNQILLVQLHPLTENDKPSFMAFFDYLYTRNRCGVISNCAQTQVLKDFYILPIHKRGHIPEILKPIDGPGLDRREPNCLLGLLVKTNRPSSASGLNSSYTPTPLK